MKSLALLLTATFAIGLCALNFANAKAPDSRIINGVEASVTDFPHQVALKIGNDTFWGKCGGALISERHVLTAAHCIIDTNGWAWVGTNRFGKGTEITFSKVSIHTKWDTDTLKNDIAIVHLDKPVKPNGSTIKIIELDRTPLEKDVKVTTSGYGKISDAIDTDILYYINLNTQGLKQCDSFYNITITEKMVCACPVKGEGTCVGDSGGALVRNWPENPVHVGITSFGPQSTCHRHYSRVFTRTAEYIDWIEEKTKF